MRLNLPKGTRILLIFFLLAGTLLPLQAKTAKKPPRKHSSGVVKASAKKPVHTAHKATRHSAHSAVRHKKKSRRASWRRGQQKIDPQRTRDIQAALIREHYLQGKPSGNWDVATQKALQHYQADNGWQSKTVPDSRALIKLGLGPDRERLLNPESAMTMQVPAHDDGNADPPTRRLPTIPAIQPASTSSQPQQQ